MTADFDLPAGRPLILFDGVCRFCSGAVRFILSRDPNRQFLFAPLQSDAGRAVLRRFGIPDGEIRTIVCVEDGCWWSRSTAALRIARRMSGLWPLLYGFILLPTFCRDVGYEILARNRYRWFGRSEACFVPSAEHRAQFLETRVDLGLSPGPNDGSRSTG